MSSKELNLANLLRPRRIEDIKGQAQTTSVLKSQMQKGRLAGNYVFAGKYGCGKTTAARIVAMAMTCEEPDGNGEPCGKCESCRSIIDYGASINVMEVNAASNRGIDNIREIIERIQTPPAGGAAKRVVILDEAHMLTPEASNALLKTLEEPPEWVSFILCTTEAERILPTIKSRCQCFRFEPISEKVMAQTVTEVLDERGIRYEEKVPKLLAHLAVGSFRDCLSSLEQCMDALSGNEMMSADLVCAIKGVASLDTAYTVLKAYLAGDTGAVLAETAEARLSGTRATSYADSIMEMTLSAMFEASGRHQENGYDMSFIKPEEMQDLVGFLKAVSDVRAKMNAFSEPFIQLSAVLAQETMKRPFVGGVVKHTPEPPKAETEPPVAEIKAPEPVKAEETKPETEGLADGFTPLGEDEPSPFDDGVPFEEDIPFEEDKKPEPEPAKEPGKKKISAEEFFGNLKAKVDDAQKEGVRQDICGYTEGGEEDSGTDEGNASDFDWGF